MVESAAIARKSRGAKLITRITPKLRFSSPQAIISALDAAEEDRLVTSPITMRAAFPPAYVVRSIDHPVYGDVDEYH